MENIKYNFNTLSTANKISAAKMSPKKIITDDIEYFNEIFPQRIEFGVRGQTLLERRKYETKK